VAANTPPRGLGPADEFTVAPGEAGGTAPRGPRVLMYDYGFRAPATIPRRGTLVIENAGLNFHLVLGIRLNPGLDPAEVREQLMAGAPGEFVSILGVVGPGTTNYVQTDLKPGTYLLVCFFADRHSAGHEHSEFGMVRKVVVR
jgi:hypothetical protein